MTCSAASTAAYLSSAMTTATGSPTCLTAPRASAQCSGVRTSTPGGTQAIGSGAALVTSSPAYTARTPGSASAALLSSDVIFACASGERTNAAYSIPGRTTSST